MLLILLLLLKYYKVLQGLHLLDYFADGRNLGGNRAINLLECQCQHVTYT